MSTESRLSIVSPYLRMIQPRPPPSVRPATPVWVTMPVVTASPNACVAHAGYEQHRRVWNGSIDRHPALIARCAGVADVRSAIGFARTHDLLVAVRGGAHSFPGYSVCDGGMVIDHADGTSTPRRTSASIGSQGHRTIERACFPSPFQSARAVSPHTAYRWCSWHGYAAFG